MTEEKVVTIATLEENLNDMENLGNLLMNIPKERLQEMRKEIREAGGNDDLVEYIDIELSTRGLFGRT